MIYMVMDRNGGHASDVEAYNDDEAWEAAEEQGYTVLDVTDLGDDLVVVIA